MSRLRPWFLVLVWAAAIFAFSTDSFSSDNTQGVVVGILHTLLPSAPAETLLTMHTFLRKSAHVGEYFILGLLLFRAIRAPKQGWRFRWACIAILLAAIYAASDEFHQIFVPSRGPAVADVLLDTAGAIAAQFAVWLILRRENALHSGVESRIS
jgi:VanZ family protein